MFLVFFHKSMPNQETTKFIETIHFNYLKLNSIFVLKYFCIQKAEREGVMKQKQRDNIIHSVIHSPKLESGLVPDCRNEHRYNRKTRILTCAKEGSQMLGIIFNLLCVFLKCFLFF